MPEASDIILVVLVIFPQVVLPMYRFHVSKLSGCVSHPAFVIELLTQLTKVCKDYIGVLNEESLRKNFSKKNLGS